MIALLHPPNPFYASAARMFLRCLATIGLTLSFPLLVRSAAGDDLHPPPTPTAAFLRQEVEGWTVLLHPRLAAEGDHAELGAQVLKLLQAKLVEVRRVLPERTTRFLQGVPIWIEHANTRAGRGACYHPSADWLRGHGFNPDKGRSIEVCVAGNFIGWASDQPAAILHELAHAWHHQVLGNDEPRIKALWEAAVASGRYDDVLHISGRRQRHYALNNHKEYFAEMSEAYFWTNDFYPFVRAELREADPAMFELLGEVWNVAPPERESEPGQPPPQVE